MNLGEAGFASRQNKHHSVVFPIFITQLKKNTKHFSFQNCMESLGDEIK